jgi:Immunity protein 44
MAQSCSFAITNHTEGMAKVLGSSHESCNTMESMAVKGRHSTNRTIDAMELWMGGEIQVDVGDAYREARNEVEAALKDVFAGDYGPGLVELAFIGMIDPTSFYPEVKKYSARKKEAEFRLYIDYDAFRSATGLKQRAMICDTVIRAVRLLPEVGATRIDCERLVADILSVAAQKGWPVISSAATH